MGHAAIAAGNGIWLSYFSLPLFRAAAYAAIEAVLALTGDEARDVGTFAAGSAGVLADTVLCCFLNSRY